MAHKDLSEAWRGQIERAAEHDARTLTRDGQSLALAREAWISAFDKAAEELEATDAKD